MTRVAYVCADRGVPVFGTKGSSVHVQEVVRALRGAGATVELVAAATGGAPPCDLAGVPVRHLEALPTGDAAERERLAVAGNAALRSLLAAGGGFDLVYERHALWSCAAMELARERGIPSVLEVNAPLVEEQAAHRTLINRSLAEETTRRALAAAGDVVAVSGGVARYVAAFGVPPSRIHVIPNAVAAERFPAGTPPARPAPAGVFTVGFLGTLKPWHGVQVLVEAFDRLRQEHPASRLLFVGDGPLRGDLERELARRCLGDSVEWSGAVPAAEVPAWLASMDVGVASYPAIPDFYFSPLKVLEYMAAGLPVVASDIGEIRELVEDGVHGLLCPPGEVGPLASALQRLAASPELRRSLGAAARARVLAEHAWSGTAARVLALAERQRCRDGGRREAQA